MKSTLYEQIAEKLAVAAETKGFTLPAEFFESIENYAELTTFSVENAIPVLAEQIVTLPHYEYLTIALANALPVSSTGYLSLGVKVAPSALDAVRFLIELAALVIPVLTITLSESTTTDLGVVKFAPNVAMSPAAESVLITICLIAANKELSLITGTKQNFDSIELHDGIDWPVNNLSHELQTKVSIGSSETTINFSTSRLLFNNASADSATFQLLRKELNTSLSSSHESVSIVDRTTQLVMANVRSPKTKTEISRTLNISDRQLRYALSKHHTSYQKILRECRINYAVKLLTATSSPRISEIAYLLDYSDIASFSQAFKTWTGLSPTEYRAKHLK
jgi:AraC-like DNA-binding protein